MKDLATEDPATEDLGLIEWSPAKTPARARLYPYRLPSKATAVIVKYRPKIAISCVIPPQKFEASYRLGNRSSRRRGVKEVVTPILLMTQTINEMPSSIRTRGVTEGYSLWALRLEGGELGKTKEMTTSPYLFGNVWDKGAICFGGMTPESLRQAFNYYWSSGFNDELYRDQGHHVCNSKSHNYRSSHIGCQCEKKYKHDCLCSRKTSHGHHNCGCGRTITSAKKCKGSCATKAVDALDEDSKFKDLYKIVMLTFSMQGFPFGGTGHGVENSRDACDTPNEPISEASAAVFTHWVTTVEEGRQKLPLRRDRNQVSGALCQCCLSISTILDKAKRAARTVGKELGPRQLSKYTVVENEPYPGCGCGWRHKNTCDCRASRCQCPCVCECCLKTCGHPVCKCVCCRGECGCHCNCSTAVKFKEHLGVYHDKILPSQPWKDRTALFCGEAYWAAPKVSAAVLVTNHPYLVMHIPEKYRRKMYSGLGIIALGKEEGDCWEFNSGTYKFRVPTSLVTAN